MSTLQETIEKETAIYVKDNAVTNSDAHVVPESRLKHVLTNRFLLGFLSGTLTTVLGYSLYSYYSTPKTVECIF